MLDAHSGVLIALLSTASGMLVLFLLGALTTVRREKVRRLATSNQLLTVEAALRISQRRFQELLAHAQKAEAVGQLTGGVAHDFNNLLTAIQLNADVLSACIKDENLRPVAEAMRTAAECGAMLTKRLLAFASREVLEPEPTAIGELVSGMEHLLRRTLGANIDIEFIAAPGLWPAKVDPGQFETALLNLALNARDAMPVGGQITIETCNVKLDERDAKLNDMRAGAYVMIATSDNGTGMSAEVVARAFEPFFTTKENGRGTGLGLSMIHNFIQQAGGYVKVRSALGVGTVVKLYLPRAETTAPVFPRHAALPPDLPRGDENVFLVEDDPLVRTYTADLLASLGYHVTTAESATQALVLLDKLAMPDLLFTDVVMPGMTGPALARQLRKRWPRLKVLLMSGYPKAGCAGDSEIAGMAIMGKPFRRGEAALRIRQALDEGVNEPARRSPVQRQVA